MPAEAEYVVVFKNTVLTLTIDTQHANDKIYR